MDTSYTMDGSSLTMATEEVVKRDWVKIGLVILVLALLGFNIFAYLGAITEWFSRTFGPLFRGTIGTAVQAAAETTKQTISTSAEGTQAAVGAIAQGATSGISEVQSVLDGQAQTISSSGASRVRNNIDNRGIDSIFSKAESQFVIDQDDEDMNTTYVGQKTKGHHSGYCYIGEDRGNRTCIEVGKGERCMSGDIYPTMDVCINPSLRP